jgi:MFS superfamily sulfate permease-like transporter
MPQGMLKQLLQDFTSRPKFLGFSIGLVLAFVVWRLLENGYALGLLGIPILILMSWWWIQKPIYTAICIAVYVATFLGLFLWKPHPPDRVTLGAEKIRQHVWPWIHRP